MDIEETNLDAELEKAVLRAKENLDDFDKESFLEEKQEIKDETLEIDDKKGSKLLPALLLITGVSAVIYTIWSVRNRKNGTV